MILTRRPVPFAEVDEPFQVYVGEGRMRRLAHHGEGVHDAAPRCFGPLQGGRTTVDRDEHPRPDATIEKLSSLKTAYEKSERATLTASWLSASRLKK